jgi:short-subunit dehydrogenase
MRASFRPLSEQVMVITGASSGIGLCTARAAAREGARVVLGARSADVLDRVVGEIQAEGGQAMAVDVDVADAHAVERLAARAIERFGRIDTWVNNAGVSIYGELTATPVEDHRRLFETNYWGVVHGSVVAVRHLREHGGALINVGSVAGDRAFPLQGAYSASKHAVRGFTEALRMELEHAGLPISVTLIKPGSIATPYHEHARALTAYEPRNAPPLYAPELVTKAILRAATEPVRDVFVGGSARALSALGTVAPRLADRLFEGTLFKLQQSDTPKNGRRDILYAPSSDARVRGGSKERVMERSFTDRAAERPGRALLLGAALVAGVALLVRAL